MKNYIIKYKYPIFCIILYALFFLQMQNVNMYADDYYIIKMNNDINQKSLYTIIIEIFYMMKGYYDTWSGRLIGHFIVTIVTLFKGITLYKILNPIFLFLFSYLIAKIINLYNKLNTSKILFFITVTVLGLNIHITRELLYWTDSTILFFWSYTPTLLIIYYILKCEKENVLLSSKQFMLLIFLVFIINFTMESTMMFIVLFLSFYTIFGKKIDKKVYILCIFSILMLIIALTIPGNQKRLVAEFTANNINSSNFIFAILKKTNPILTDLFCNPAICFYTFATSCIISTKILYNKNNSNKLIKHITLINLLLIIIFSIIATLVFYNQIYINNIYLIPIELTFLIINLYLMFYYLKKCNFMLFFLILAGFIASITTIAILPMYFNSRYYFTFILALLIFNIYIFFNSKKNEQIVILLIYTMYTNLFFSLIFLIINLTLKIQKKVNIKIIYKLTITVFLIMNLYNFTITIINYYKNNKIFEYNIEKIYQIKSAKYVTNTKIIELKKLHNLLYAYDMPEYAPYTLDWYKDYHEIKDYEIIWVPQ